MSIRTTEELIQLISSSLPDVTTDEALSLMEDVQDTIAHLENSSNIDWQQRYEENDAEWRRRYSERFFTGVDTDDKDDKDDKDDNNTDISYDDLFNKKED